MKRLFIALMFLLVANTVFAEEDAPLLRLSRAKTVKCSWGEGVTAHLDNGKVSIESGKWHSKPEESITVIDAIDIKAGKARLIGNQGAVDVGVVFAMGGLTIIEWTIFESPSIITIFPQLTPEGDRFFAVMSRHINIPTKGALPSQFYGMAEIMAEQ
jgi:hypothetical protein